MAFDGSGNFVRLFNWVTDKINNVNITASRMDGEDNGFAAGLTLCVTRDGQGKMAADFAPTSDAAYDLGTALLHWRDLNISRNATVAKLIKANTPVFTAYLGSSLNLPVASQTIKFDTVGANVGSNYATGTGLFTAPVAGLYQFNCALFLTNNATGTASFTNPLQQVNGLAGPPDTFQMVPTPVTAGSAIASGASVNFVGTRMILMAAADTYQIKITVTAVNGTGNLICTTQSYLTGGLIMQTA